jgi:hypothetical protein
LVAINSRLTEGIGFSALNWYNACPPMSDRANTWLDSSTTAAMEAIHCTVLFFIFHGVLVNNHLWFCGFMVKDLRLVTFNGF